jgi:hypothetical protein
LLLCGGALGGGGGDSTTALETWNKASVTHQGILLQQERTDVLIVSDTKCDRAFWPGTTTKLIASPSS